MLRTMPFFGPARVAILLAVIGTPHRFRGRRQIWPYAGLAVVTRTSGEGEFVDGKLRQLATPAALVARPADAFVGSLTGANLLPGRARTSA